MPNAARVIENFADLSGSVGAHQLGFASDSTVFAQRGATDALSGTALRDAYAIAKLLTPGGGALSATNKATVLIPPGSYDMGATPFVLDSAYVRLMSLAPYDPWATFMQHPMPLTLTYPLLTPVVLYTAGGSGTTGHPCAIQTADGLELFGISIWNKGTGLRTAGVTGTGGNPATVTSPSVFTLSDVGLLLACTVTRASRYHGCVFLSTTYSHEASLGRSGVGPVMSAYGYDLGGLWSHCFAGCWGPTGWLPSKAWRIGENRTCNPVMRYCKTSGYLITNHESDSNYNDAPIGGDAYGVTLTGIWYHVYAGGAAFGGCSSLGAQVTSTARFYFCEAGKWSYGLGHMFDGQAYDCLGGIHSFGGSYFNSPNVAENGWIGPNAILERCKAAGGLSFGAGGGQATRKYYPNERYFGVQGVLKDCECLGLSAPIWLAGGRVDGCRFKVTTADKSVFRIRKSGTKILSTVAIANGTGRIFEMETAEKLAKYGNDGPQLNTTNTKQLLPIKIGTVVTITYKDAGSVLKTITIDESDAFGGDYDPAGVNTIDRANGRISVKRSASGDASTYGIVATFTPADMTYIAAGCFDNAKGADAGLTNVLTTHGNVSDEDLDL